MIIYFHCGNEIVESLMNAENAPQVGSCVVLRRKDEEARFYRVLDVAYVYEALDAPNFIESVRVYLQEGQ